ncbi:hypothetical protein AVEN_199447-1 [Araneus ventricosus]|uniref:Uncharacterized protein n=1 Tax=Araneus ventricosus TaxID=182803 RepID=A0A4Y2W3Y2_ARAVE|nr:hypothetical protein AVEN_245844-1 [Araneus ventricosus]GBO32389.1 hypothetical protein AVEN_253653-1 [Araneus ventricosus]GBO32393.1 hypothetical protein AVEN_22066-1 [Araneus ventricosus]GBO32395.1 hypothetical protein AVEN_132776-1 [Araneus ventricosus]GBO34638.1 hypothetical protein AVEN_199447-1 [Araneus ventricosus]
MNFTTIPTLEKLLHFATRVCDDTEFKSMLKRCETRFNEDSKYMINERSSSFKSPKSLHQKVEVLIKPVMIEICAWTLYICHIHDEVAKFSRTCCCCLDEIDLQESLQWQTDGLIDKHLTS